jgi:hypothetical protein
MKIQLMCCVLLFLGSPSLRAEDGVSSPVEQQVHKIIQREHEVTRDIERFHPLVETYVQVLRQQREQSSLWYDRHFVSQAEFANGLRAVRFNSRHMAVWRDITEFSESFSPKALEYDPSGFVAMAYPEPSTFNLKHYKFQYVNTEFLGEVRCQVFQVMPSASRTGGLFKGKIWVEDQDLTIIRFNGKYQGSNMINKYFHFDSWRVNVGPHRWVPAAIYSGETGLPCCGFWKLNWTKVRFKARTTFWGYDLHFPGSDEELSRIVVDPSTSIRDESDRLHDVGPIDQLHIWQSLSENNVSEKLERSGLLARPGEVEKTLQTVINNIEVTNHLSIEPEVKCRVLLTSNLESAVIGHTIILSRGLIDVLPDEATLAALLAHDLAHIQLEGYSDARFSWADESMFGPRDVMKRLRFAHSARQEERASSLAREWMSKSPYKDSLGSVAGFSAELHWDSPHIGRLLGGTIGESLYDMLDAGHVPLEALAPNRATEVRALPLGSRIAIDPWSDQLAFVKSSGGRVRSSRDNLPFEVTPVSLYLRRVQDSPGPEVAFSTSGSN